MHMYFICILTAQYLHANNLKLTRNRRKLLSTIIEHLITGAAAEITEYWGRDEAQVKVNLK